MRSIRIVVERYEIEVVSSTFTLRSENNALSSDFKGIFNSFPFLVVENEITKKALGSIDITSINKKKVVSVFVHLLGHRYYGQLQILSIIKGFRKCDLKFFSKIIEITSLKLPSFMPVISVIPNETNPIPYTDKSENYVSGAEHWKYYPIPFLSQSFPEVKWQFPSIYFSYNGTVANMYNYELTEYYLNHSYFAYNKVYVNNLNYTAPQVYLLSPLFYALQKIGYKAIGDFYNDPFIARILLLSFNNNLCETLAKVPVATATWEGKPWVDYAGAVKAKITTVPILYVGIYVMHYEFRETPPWDLTSGGVNVPFHMYIGDQWYSPYNITLINENNYRSGYVKFETTSEMVGKQITLRWHSALGRVPQHSLNFDLYQEEKLLQQHPTIELGRYVPDWEFGEYLNTLKNTFNLSITVDDVSKKMFLNYNEKLTVNEKIELFRSSLFVKEYEIASTDEFVLKYQNEVDDYLVISRNEKITNKKQLSKFVNTIQNKFKFSSLSFTEKEKEKQGEGLTIYDPDNKPNLSSSYQNQNLSIDKKGGIYDVFWQKWLKYRLASSTLEMSAYLTEIEVKKAQEATAVYIDNQLYRVVFLEYTPTVLNKFKVKLKLESINY